MRKAICSRRTYPIGAGPLQIRHRFSQRDVGCQLDEISIEQCFVVTFCQHRSEAGGASHGDVPLIRTAWDLLDVPAQTFRRRGGSSCHERPAPSYMRSQPRCGARTAVALRSSHFPGDAQVAESPPDSTSLAPATTASATPATTTGSGIPIGKPQLEAAPPEVATRLPLPGVDRPDRAIGVREAGGWHFLTEAGRLGTARALRLHFAWAAHRGIGPHGFGQQEHTSGSPDRLGFSAFWGLRWLSPAGS